MFFDDDAGCRLRLRGEPGDQRKGLLVKLAGFGFTQRRVKAIGVCCAEKGIGGVGRDQLLLCEFH
jgi:hypothetical protein